MPKPLTARQRLDQAKALIQQARELPEPAGLGYRDLSFVAQVKDLLRQARNLVKFLQYSPSLDEGMRREVQTCLDSISTAEIQILKK